MEMYCKWFDYKKMLVYFAMEMHIQLFYNKNALNILL